MFGNIYAAGNTEKI